MVSVTASGTAELSMELLDDHAEETGFREDLVAMPESFSFARYHKEPDGTKIVSTGPVRQAGILVFVLT